MDDNVYIAAPFYMQNNITIKPPPIVIGLIKLVIGNNEFRFEPQRDMTAYEMAKIWQLVMGPPQGWPSQQNEIARTIYSYMKVHGLERHFVKER